MKFTETKIKGVYIIEPEPYIDERGHFVRLFCKREMAKAGIDYTVVQINRSLTKQKGTIRGLHYQNAPHQEDKIIHCPQGELYDVVLDLRKDSPTFGTWLSEILSSENRKMILIPKGCANGIQTLQDNCLLEYFVSEYYTPESESGIRWNDPAFNIPWPIKEPFISDKDQRWKDYNKN